MLPQVASEDVAHPPSRTIYINPNFNKAVMRGPIDSAAIAAKNVMAATTTSAHINPLFLRPQRPPAIHMNPQFLQKKLLEQQQQHQHQLQKQQSKLVKDKVIANKSEESNAADSHLMHDLGKLGITTENSRRKIITKSRTCIVREPVSLVQKPIQPITAPAPGPIIRLSKCKLIRRVATPATMKLTSITTAKPKPASAIASAKPVRSIASTGRYKVDNRAKGGVGPPLKMSTLIGHKRRSFVARYALRRSTSEQQITRRKVLPSATSGKSRFKLQPLPVNKQLHLLNINGVLYKSTRNKLQRKDTQNTTAAISSNTSTAAVVATATRKLTRDRTLFVRGTKFVMDANGYKLTRIVTSSSSSLSTPSPVPSSVKQRQRIDIGGLTYIASSTQNVFVRTRNHLALAHLNIAKQRSLQLLTSHLVKSNVPCAIYQRVGRCVAHERNKCNKAHDKKQVIICPRFLRSECQDPNCLLSHNVSLSKMPVCKFFLQGVCVRADCPYLHKKLSTKAGVCLDFLRGYCKLAEQCNKRHEFICPQYARMGECKIVNCTYCRTLKRKAGIQQQKTPPAKLVKVTHKSEADRTAIETDKEKDTLPLRYFSDKTNISMSNENVDGTNSMDVEMKINDASADVVTDNADVTMPSSTEAPARLVRPKVGSLPAFIPLS